VRHEEFRAKAIAAKKHKRRKNKPGRQPPRALPEAARLDEFWFVPCLCLFLRLLCFFAANDLVAWVWLPLGSARGLELVETVALLRWALRGSTA
jgi:hypothetical protein